MQADEFTRHIEQVMKGILALNKAKGKEYTESSTSRPDRLSQFKNIAEYDNEDPQRVLYGFVRKHWDALRTIILEGRPFTLNTITPYTRDIILYMLLLEGLAIDNEKEE